jgi:hypothetical protein
MELGGLEPPNCWVRSICGGRCLSVCGRRSALPRGSQPGGRCRGRSGFEPVCLWCARGGPCPQGRRSRLDQPQAAAQRFS